MFVPVIKYKQHESNNQSYTVKKKKDGTIPIYIRITENRKSRYQSTGLSVKSSDWNSNKQKVSSSHRDSKQLNIELEQKLSDVKSIKR